MTRLTNSFFQRDVLDVAPDLIGKIIVRQFNSNHIQRYRITETEAYRGEEDSACHASKGYTARTAVMYQPGGRVYVYLIYGMYWMLNFVTGDENFPSAVLIRGVEKINGPGKLGKALHLDKSFYGEDLSISNRIWVEDGDNNVEVIASKRIGVDYAGEWALKDWRFTVKPL